VLAVVFIMRIMLDASSLFGFKLSVVRLFGEMLADDDDDDEEEEETEDEEEDGWADVVVDDEDDEAEERGDVDKLPAGCDRCCCGCCGCCTIG
jgi:hypothetical protein